ncbi:MAG TPA: site-specific integrase [Polyangiaceae bacterium]|nr:site-specific integrase [Polyangiaceae bacterium]
MVDGERIRRCVALGTSNRAVAAAKLARLVEGGADAATAAAPETFEQAARRILATQGIKTAGERMSRLERIVFPAIGHMAVTEIRPAHVRAVLDAAAAEGKSRVSVNHIKVDISTVLTELWRDEVVSENVALRVLVPKRAAVDERQRVVLTDEEFERFMASPEVSQELHMMALTSRCFGGMRTSDLHAWDWSHVDTVNWLDAYVSRPKTKSRDRLALPELLVPPLQAWWGAAGRPASGPVFPERHGKRAGQRRTRRSYARRLRKALWVAGIRRGETPEACELQTDTAETRCCDFHSFRRQFNTSLASAGVNVQVAMRLAGHRNTSTHMRYVLLAERLEVPRAALPKLSGKSLAYASAIAQTKRPQSHTNRSRECRIDISTS